jgi:predicted nucleic acid-binding protein
MEGPEGPARFAGVRAPAPEREAAGEDRGLNSVLIDSDILIEVSRARDTEILSHWDELSRGSAALLCSPVTVAEIWHGARPHEHRILDALFAAVDCIPIDAEIGKRAGVYLRDYAKSHSVELGDALIAATASLHKLALWTRNRRHYPMRDLRFY